MKRVITCEGIIDTTPDQEFDMNCLMVNPVTRIYYPGNIGEIDKIVEEYTIDVALNDPSAELNEIPKEQWLVQEMEKCKAGEQTRAMKKRGTLYWKRVVEIDDEDDSYYLILERVLVD